MQNWRKGREGSVWNLFQQKANLDDDLRDILEEVTAVKKVSMSSRASILDMMQIKECLSDLLNSIFSIQGHSERVSKVLSL